MKAVHAALRLRMDASASRRLVVRAHTNSFRAVPGNLSISINPKTTTGQTLYDFFQQRFAGLPQPALDPSRARRRTVLT